MLVFSWRRCTSCDAIDDGAIYLPESEFVGVQSAGV